MPRRARLLIDVLRQPDEVLELTPPLWDLLLRQARAAGVTPHLERRLDAAGLRRNVPQAPRQHLLAARRQAEQHRNNARRCLARLCDTMAAARIPVMLCGQAACLLADPPLAEAWADGDLDVAVARDHEAAADAALRQAGWQRLHGQRRYRHAGDLPEADPPCTDAAAPAPATRWLQHNAPGLQLHVLVGLAAQALERRTAQATGHAAPLATTLATAHRDPPIEGLPGLHLPSPPDRVLLAAARLYRTAPDEHALCALLDLDQLLRHHGRRPDFWHALASRAVVLGLQRPLFYLLHHGRAWLDTPVPRAMLAFSTRHAPAKPWLALVDACWRPWLMPELPRAQQPRSAARRAASALLGCCARVNAARPAPMRGSGQPAGPETAGAAMSGGAG